MAATKEIMAGGISAIAADSITGSQTTGITATGSTQLDAKALTTTDNAVSTAAAGTGVILPQWATPGDDFMVYNGGANALLVYPPLGSSATINAGAANAGFSVATTKSARFKMLSATVWVAGLSA